MGYKEIMSQVDKVKAVQFMTNLKTGLSLNGYRYFDNEVRTALASVGLPIEGLGGNSLNAIVDRMERKSKINL